MRELLEFLKKCRKEHYTCIDNYYNCPKIRVWGLDDPVETDRECECGAEEFNKELDELLFKYNWVLNKEFLDEICG